MKDGLFYLQVFLVSGFSVTLQLTDVPPVFPINIARIQIYESTCSRGADYNHKKSLCFMALVISPVVDGDMALDITPVVDAEK